LLDAGADPNYKDLYGRTALHHAINVAEKGSNASFELEDLLLKYGANINA
jgi:ankyrin repeat protein